MSIRALFNVMQEYTSCMNQASSATRQLMQAEIQKIHNLTQKEVFWLKAQAVATGCLGGLAAAASVGSCLVPQNFKLGSFDAKKITDLMASSGKGLNTFQELVGHMARGQSTTHQSMRSVLERCSISHHQQEEGKVSSHYNQMIQSVQGILSAKARLS